MAGPSLSSCGVLRSVHNLATPIATPTTVTKRKQKLPALLTLTPSPWQRGEGTNGKMSSARIGNLTRYSGNR